jgi:hypothetical protein
MMPKYAIKKPSGKPGVWEWYSVKDPDSSYVELEFFNSREEAVEFSKTWAANSEVVEISK